MSDVKLHVASRGLQDLKKEMTSVAPDLKNRLLKTYRDVAKDIAYKASARVNDEPPMRGWRTPGPRPRNGKWIPWDPARVRAGFVYKTGVKDDSGRGKAFGYRVLNASPQGSIAEMAGSKNAGKQGRSNNPDAGRLFISNLNFTYGRPGRFVWKIYDAMAAEVQDKTAREVQNIANEYEARINSLGGGN